MSVTINHIKASKTDWTSTHPDGTVYPGHERVQIACLQRIADATEKMASSYTDLERDRNWHKEVSLRRLESIRKMERQIAGLKGVITKLKKKAGK